MDVYRRNKKYLEFFILLLISSCARDMNEFGTNQSIEKYYLSNANQKSINFLHEHGSYENSVEFLITKVTHFPNSIRYRLLLARLYLQKGKFKLAKSHAEKIEEMQFSNIESKIIISIVYYHQNLIEKAKLVINNLLGLENLQLSERIELLNLLAGVSLKEGKSQLVLRYLKEALNLDENFAATNRNIGLVYFENREFDLAEKYFLKILRVHPNDFFARMQLGACAVGLKKYNNAAMIFDELYKENPKNHNLLYHISYMNLKNKRVNISVDFLKKYIDVAPVRFIAKEKALYLINDIQLLSMHNKEVSIDNISNITDYLNKKYSEITKESLHLDKKVEIDTNYVFTSLNQNFY